MANVSHLHGACACERNQYTIVIPHSSASEAHVFFDNSAATRRSQATPITAWLRVPLDWYHSSTSALFPDETHASIRRTFHTPAPQPSLPPTRRQFCGYCGTHLTAWNEAHRARADVLDVTLGSLWNESLDSLQALGIIQDGDEEETDDGDNEDEDGANDLVTGGSIDRDDHIPTDEHGVDDATARSLALSPFSPHQMQHRGMPYFEEMVENSRLGRIKRRKGGHTSRDGTTSVQWEIVEIGGGNDDGVPVEEVAMIDEEAAVTATRSETGNKRQKIGA